MVWIIMAGMAVLAALAAIWPVLRAAPASPEADSSAAEADFYKAQLKEIGREVERGQLPQSEAAQAHAEVARRLLAVRAGVASGKTSPRSRNRLVAAVVIAAGIPAVAFPLYARIGQPQMPDAPLASRSPTSLASKDVEAAVAGVEAHLLADPKDGKGWVVLAPVYMRLGRYDDAAHAYAAALGLLGEDGDRRAAYGEALVAVAGGVVTEKAREAFTKALAEAPGNPQARFYLALATEQDGKKEEALKAYADLAADAPTDAAWLGTVQERLASLKGEPKPPPAEAAPLPASDGQRTMIEGMVSRLADRLASKGGNIDEWERLIRAYTVLHQADKAKSALAEARKALGPDPNAVAGLDAFARDLGLGGAN